MKTKVNAALSKFVIHIYSFQVNDRVQKDVLLSKRVNHEPPCMQPLEDLTEICLSQLSNNDLKNETVLVVRPIRAPVQLGSLLPIMNVVEDSKSHVIHVEVYFPSTIPSTAILAKGIVLAIKTPTYEMGKHGPCFKVFHPSDVMILEQGHELIPKAFTTASESTSKSIWDWKEEAELASNHGAYSKALHSYSEAIDLAVANQEEHHQLATLHHVRSLAATRAGYHELALEDATISIRSCSDEDFRRDGRKPMIQLVNAAYQEKKFDLVHRRLEHLLSLLPKNSQAVGLFEEVASRIQEDQHGLYDFPAMRVGSVPLNHASFTRLTEVRASGDRGRGLFTSFNIPRGGLVLCEQPFGVGLSTAVTRPLSSSNAYTERNANTKIWLDIVQKVFANPSRAGRLLSLHAGSAYSPSSSTPIIDGRPIIDVFQILEIIDHNCFGHYVDYDSTGLPADSASNTISVFVQASYMNHSCVQNTSRSFVGDMIVVRANSDIPAGTELTTSYVPAISSEPNRHAELLDSWHFECACPLCESEKHCRDDLKELFHKVARACPARSIDPYVAIEEMNELIKELEKVYSDSRFDNVPRIGMQDPQASLLDLWISLRNHARIREHATALLRERGYWIVATNGGDGKLQLEGECGMPHRTVVRALHSLARFPEIGGCHEESREYLEMAEQMWNVFNDTSITWEEELGTLDEIM
ncbi:SET domain-containing protein [Aureobasidium subglaciale]|nr:SET domain-containing protein [Aureobasidium subglaciale]